MCTLPFHRSPRRRNLAPQRAAPPAEHLTRKLLAAFACPPATEAASGTGTPQQRDPRGSEGGGGSVAPAGCDAVEELAPTHKQRLAAVPLLGINSIRRRGKVDLYQARHKRCVHGPGPPAADTSKALRMHIRAVVTNSLQDSEAWTNPACRCSRVHHHLPLDRLLTLAPTSHVVGHVVICTNMCSTAEGVLQVVVAPALLHTWVQIYTLGQA